LERLPGWQEDHLILAATHTHCAPDSQRLNQKMTFPVPGIATFQEKALDWTADQIAQAVRDAERNMQPVSLRLGMQQAGLSRLRRWQNLTREPQPLQRSGPLGWDWVKRPAPEIPEEDLLRIAEFVRSDGQPLAVVVNYAAHPTIFSEKMLEVSAEYPGELARRWEGKHPGGMLLFINGAQGDRSPIADDGVTEEEKMQRYAGRVLGIVERAEKEAIIYPFDGIKVRSAEIQLPPVQPHPQLVEQVAKQGISKELLQRVAEGFMPKTTICVWGKVGAWEFIAVPGEPTTTVGRELRRGFPQTTHLFGLANDWIGYIPTPDQYRVGGYEATVSFNGPGLAAAIVRAFRSLL
jgi:neutral ceramidase